MQLGSRPGQIIATETNKLSFSPSRADSATLVHPICSMLLFPLALVIAPSCGRVSSTAAVVATILHHTLIHGLDQFQQSHRLAHCVFSVEARSILSVHVHIGRRPAIVKQSNKASLNACSNARSSITFLS